jgi:lauroyl/myristoyl acyltransferase
VIACPSIDPYRYMARGEGPIVPEITGDTKQDVRRLAQRVIETLEGYIRRWPDEWLMFFPLWPELAAGAGK